jgi:ribosome maturation protein SDO1
LFDNLQRILPIKLEVKKIRVIVPAQHTGRSYGVLKDYIERENWLSNGDLEAILNIPSGMVFDFYDKLNSITHGSVVSEEIKE